MPDLMINPFDDNGYDMATMTEAVNLIPNNYGRVRAMGLFTPDPVRTRMVTVESVNGVLTLLQSVPVGSPPAQKRNGKATMVPFIVPHIPYETSIKAEDLQGIRQAGSVDPKTLEIEMSKRLTEMRGAHAITEEFLMVGAMKGEILNADGTVISNLHTTFGVTPKTVTFALTTDSTNVAGKCREVLRHIEDNLLGDVASGVHCLCGEKFFDELIGHPEVEKFYLNHAQAIELTGSGADPRKGFSFGGITFEEYRAKATDPTTGDLRQFIGDDDAHFFPVGTQSTFKIHYAPANFMESVNTYGMPIFAKQTMEAKGRWVDINTESNPLPLCRRPGVLVKGTKA
jgi:hypothetical protein